MLDPTRRWPPDYVAHLAWRGQQLELMRSDPVHRAGALLYYETRPDAFICDWADTYDPRNAGVEGRVTRMPFILFDRQMDFVEYLYALFSARASGLCEKSRDMGITWICIWFAIWMFVFVRGSSTGFGSRKSELVDKIGEMDSIFEKIRWSLRGLPVFFRPPGFKPDVHMSHMKIFNPAMDTSISGEGGDDIGRGGRKRFYVVDESSHLEHPESVEASLGDNTDCRLDVSSVSEPNNVFHRKRKAGVDWRPGLAMTGGKTYVFVADWRDHPAKSLEWYRGREEKAREAGLLHVFRSEVDRDYFAAIVGQIIDPAWVDSAVDADLKLGIKMDEGGWGFGLDVGDSEDGDRNAASGRRGVRLSVLDEWIARDTGVTTRRVVDMVRAVKARGEVHVMYDCIGAGSGVKAEANRLGEEMDSEGRLLTWGIEFVPWNAGSGPLYPKRRMLLDENGEPDKQSPRNVDFYDNLKAQGWWELRLRFERTHRMVRGEAKFPVDQLICIDGRLPLRDKLKQELIQPIKGKTARLRMKVDKLGEGQRSPNLGDCVMQNYWPVPISMSASPQFDTFVNAR